MRHSGIARAFVVAVPLLSLSVVPSYAGGPLLAIPFIGKALGWWGGSKVAGSTAAIVATKVPAGVTTKTIVGEFAGTAAGTGQVVMREVIRGSSVRQLEQTVVRAIPKIAKEAQKNARVAAQAAQ